MLPCFCLYRPSSRRAVSSGSRAFIVLSPSEDQVTHGVRSVIAMFENTVSQFGSLLKDCRLSTFYSPPKYDLKLQVLCPALLASDLSRAVIANLWYGQKQYMI